MESLNVHVVEDDEVVRESLGRLLSSAGYAATYHEDAIAFLANFQPRRPHCMLLDLRLPRMSGLEVLRRLRSEGHNIPVIVLTGFGTVSTAVQAFKLGVIDYIEKPWDSVVLLDTVNAAIEADRSQVRNKLVRDEAAGKLARLTAREREVFSLLADGCTSKEVAAALHIAKKTVDLHRSRVMHKLDATSTVDLASVARAIAP